MNIEYANLSRMRGEVGRLIGNESTAIYDDIDDALNRALDAVAGMGWRELQRSDETGLRAFNGTAKTITAGDPYIPGPFQVQRLRAIQPFDASLEGLEIIDDTDLYKRAGFQLNSTGAPRYAAYVGTTIQHAAFSGAQSCAISCSVATNDGNKTLRIDYEKSAGYVGQQNWEDVGGGFSGGVALGATANGPYGLRRLMVPVSWAGDITVVAGGSTTVASIQQIEVPPTNTNDGFQIVARPLYRIWPVPDADYACSLSWTRSPARLTEDNDIPEIPVSSYLTLAAASDLYLSTKGDEAMSGRYAQQAGAVIAELKKRYTGFARLQAIPAQGSFIGQTGVR